MPHYALIEPQTAAQLEAIATLFREYVDWLGVDLAFQDFAEELAHLPGKYARPDGRLYLLRKGDAAIGCIALRRWDQDAGEIKRLYVRPTERGGGLGRALTCAAIDAAREIGYRRLLLDSLPQMGAAQALYRTLGFVQVPPYYRTPIAGTVFMALELAAARDFSQG